MGHLMWLPNLFNRLRDVLSVFSAENSFLEPSTVVSKLTGSLGRIKVRHIPMRTVMTHDLKRIKDASKVQILSILESIIVAYVKVGI